MTSEELNRLHRVELIRYARKLLGGDDHRAEDLVQEMLGKYARCHSSIRNHLAWAYRALRNSCLNELRRRNRFTEIEGESLDSRDSGAEAPPEESAIGELRSALADCVRKLTTRQREVIEQRYFDDLTLEEVAGSVGRGVSTVWRDATNALALLRTCLAEKGFLELPC